MAVGIAPARGIQEMEFTVSKADLLRELSLTQGVVERKTTIPILANILCEAKGSRLAITATDLELTICTSCEAKTKKDGSGTISAKKLLEIIRLLPEGDIRFKLLENHWVQLTSDKRNYKMVGMAKENFPALPVMPHVFARLPAALIADMIAKTYFAISMEESRYTLNGAKLILKPDSISLVATDGHRLALVEATHKVEGLNAEAGVLIPKKAMNELKTLAAEAGEDAQIEFAQDESNLFFRLGERQLISRKLTGQFPNYEAVLPRDNTKTVGIDRDELADALRRVSQLADQRSQAVKVSLSKEGVEISASSPEYGEAREVIEREYKGADLSIGFNAKYMLDFLAAAPQGPISLELKDEQSAGQMRPTGEEGTRYRYVIMPMRI
jgi:DNA polymerase-3 subunit beta